MNKAFDKILERLRRKVHNYYPSIDHYCLSEHAVKMPDIEKIVQKVAEEYNGGWIACSERLPDIDGNTSDIVLVCGSNGFQYMAFWCDDLKWRFCECGMAKEPVLWTEIVAWQPLPEPFKERD